MGVSAMMLFLVTIHGSKAAVDLCKVSVTTLKFPLQASNYQNVSVQDPFYLLSCGTYNTADWFSFVCFFGVPLFDCAPATTTPTTTPSTTTPTSNCAPTTTIKVSTTPSGSNAMVNLCKVNVTKLAFPLLASIYQNVSVQDPLYLLICGTYNTADWFSFVCLFQVPLYDCAPAATTIKTTTTCATVPVICPANQTRHTGVNVPGIGKLIVGTDNKDYTTSVAFCNSLPGGCYLWTPQNYSSIIIPLIKSITIDCDGESAYYFTGAKVTGTSPLSFTDVAGQPWNYFSASDARSGVNIGFFVYISPNLARYGTTIISDKNIPICFCP